MSSRFDLIAQQLLQKPFANCTVSELQQFTSDHPYIAAGQFLLAKKMLVDGLPEATSQVQKAALYYHQPAAFDAFLNAEFPDLDQFYKEAAADTEILDEAPLPIQLHLPKQEVAEVPHVAENNMEPQIIEQPGTSINDNTTTFVEDPRLEIKEEAIASQQEPEAPAIVAVPQEHSLPTPELPAFEPYHTVDYFASQGIKLSQEEATKDKMGRQLKSFTEWLKTMKRLPATEQVKDLDPHAEQKVEHLAAHSVAETEIVTEAMAEVWIKQGNLEKAAAVYNKLSLSNPSKRAYFAAKLESLKKKV